jgi:hypothetical protein
MKSLKRLDTAMNYSVVEIDFEEIKPTYQIRMRVRKQMMSHPSLNFNNVLRSAFTHADPKSVKRY